MRRRLRLLKERIVALPAPLLIAALNALMSWAINQLPGKSELSIPQGIVIGITIVCVVGLAFLGSQNSESQSNHERQSNFELVDNTWFTSLPYVLSIFGSSVFLFYLLKQGYLPKEISQYAGFASIFLFLMGTLLPTIIALLKIRNIATASSSTTERNPINPPSSSTSPTKSKYQLAIAIYPETFNSIRTKLQDIINELRGISNDSSLAIVGIRQGSIILTIEGSQIGIETIIQKHQYTELTAISGFPIKNIWKINEENSPHEAPEISFSSYLETESQVENVLKQQLNIVPEEQLFGIEEYLLRLREYLQDRKSSWFISVTGQGGIGKTSLVEKLVRENTALLGFKKLAWITAKRKYINKIGEIEHRGEALNIDSMINEIANQLDIMLPQAVEDNFLYLQNKLQSTPYLIVIDNLETLQEYESLLFRFGSDNSRNNFKPSKVIFTSRVKLAGQTNIELKEEELLGLSEDASLALIKYKGKDIKRIREARHSDLLPIYEQTEGNPLLINLVVNLIKRYSYPLKDIFNAITKSENLLDYLYGEALDSISENAQTVLHAMTEYHQSSIVSYEKLQYSSGLTDEKLKKAIYECEQRSLLLSLSSLNEEPCYSIHNLLYEYLNGN
jgi:hypothetical protein